MKRDEHGNIILTPDEASDFACFIDHTLDREWDRHTDTYLCGDTTLEEGRRRMNPEMYEYHAKLTELLLD